MVKYKLKKWYPSLPKDWEVGQIFIETTCNFGKKYIPENSTNLEDYFIGIFKSEVENSPDFWERIEELCVPIGSRFIHSNDKNIVCIIKKITGSYVYTTSYDERYPKEKCDFEFTIKTANEFIQNKTWILVEDKKPIFQTHDGVDIFKGDKYFSVDKQSFNLADNGKPQSHPFATCKSRWLTFSTIKKAEEYINSNKPKYSEKDMLSFGVFTQGICLTPVNIYSILERWKFENNK